MQPKLDDLKQRKNLDKIIKIFQHKCSFCPHLFLSDVEGKEGDSVHGKEEKEEEEINW